MVNSRAAAIANLRYSLPLLPQFSLIAHHPVRKVYIRKKESPLQNDA